MRETDGRHAAGRLTIRLPQEFGFCYGVDRAVDYAYQTRRRFPRPHRLPDGRDHPQLARQRPAPRGGRPFSERPGGAARRRNLSRCGDSPRVRRHDLGPRTARPPRLHAGRHHLRVRPERMEERPQVRARRLHGESSTGRPQHEETRATASQVLAADGGAYLIVLDRDEAAEVCEYIRGRGDRAWFDARVRRRLLARVRAGPGTCGVSVWRTRRRC